MRSKDQLEMERISFNYELEVMLIFEESISEIEDILSDLESENYYWEHTDEGREPLIHAIAYHTRHLRMIYSELLERRKPYVDQFQEEWAESGLEDLL